MNRILRCLEGWIDPFVSAPAGKLPVTAGAYLWFLVRQSPWPFVAMLLLGGATALVEAGLYSFIGIIVDLLQTTPKDELFTQNWQLFAGMAAVVLVLRTVLAFFTAGVEEQTVVPGFYARVRWQAHQRIMDQSIAFFHDEFAGRISSKVWQAGQAAGEFMVTLLQVVWYIAVYALATLLLLGELNWRLGAAILVWLAVFSVIARYYVPRIRNHSRAAAHAASGATGRLVDTYSNIQTVKLFSSRESEQAGVRAIFESYLAVLKRFTRNLTEVRSLMSLLSSVMMVSIGWFSLVLWQDGILTAGDVAVALGLALRLNLLLGRMLGQLNSLFRSFGTLQDSVDMLTRPIAVTDQPGAPALMVSAGAIVFDKVSFHYGKRGGVIDDLSFAVKGGEKIGIVGPSGAGKSTLASLLLRFHDVESGRILVDGQDIRQASQASLRAQIGMVAQDTSLLHRSIRENIAYGRPDATMAMLEDAARQAHALEFIQNLKDSKGRSGFEAQVGERGVKLSGGQRQRIAIARVLLKNAPILVLDEATSALDSEIEAAIQDNLMPLMQGKTVLAIAHRLSTIAAMDRLIVMDGGKIVEEGTHEALLARGGLYADLWERQSGGFLPAGEMMAVEER